MQLLQDILGLFRRAKTVSTLDNEDVIAIGKHLSERDKMPAEAAVMEAKDLVSWLNTQISGSGGGLGPQGPSGQNGQAASISIGSTTTGSAGTNAEVTNSGSSSNAVLNFVIPKGDTGVGAQGSQGPAGPAGPQGAVGPAGLTWQGAWSSGTIYSANDAVGYNGASYFALNGVGPSPTDPAADTTNWALLASQGAIGPAGSNGAQGVQGPVGPQGPIGLTGPQGPSLWSNVFSGSISGVYSLNLVGNNTFLLNVTAPTTLDIVGASVGDYIFIIDNTGGHIVSLQTGSTFYTNNSLQPVISGITLMKGTWDGSKMYITSLENMTNL
jgi:hypothetical protein|tara:strand:- start:15156 stop:16133 length:978 start_codon:yes stop_codon:yes gene_type:complete